MICFLSERLAFVWKILDEDQYLFFGWYRTSIWSQYWIRTSLIAQWFCGAFLTLALSRNYLFFVCFVNTDDYFILISSQLKNKFPFFSIVLLLHTRWLRLCSSAHSCPGKPSFPWWGTTPAAPTPSSQVLLLLLLSWLKSNKTVNTLHTVVPMSLNYFLLLYYVVQVEQVRSCWCLVRASWRWELPTLWPSARCSERSTPRCHANSTRWEVGGDTGSVSDLRVLCSLKANTASLVLKKQRQQELLHGFATDSWNTFTLLTFSYILLPMIWMIWKDFAN